MPATISVNFASNAEAIAGSLTNKSINPAGLKAALDSGGGGSGYVTIAGAQTITGAKTFSNILRVQSDSGRGYVRLVSGNGASVPGYISWYTSDNTRRGYLGWASGTNLILSLENGWGLSVSGNVTMGSSVTINNTVSLRAAATSSAATQIPVFTANPASTTRSLVTRTPSQLLSDMNVIAGQSEITSLQGTDEFLVRDNSANALRRVDWSVMQPSGTVLQTLFTENNSTTTNIFQTKNIWDNSVPVYSDVESNGIILTQAINISSASNKVLINAIVTGYGGSQAVALCLFDSTSPSAQAIACSVDYLQGGYGLQIQFQYLHSPNFVGTKTYRLALIGYVGTNRTFYLNRSWAGITTLGGRQTTNMIVQEIKG